MKTRLQISAVVLAAWACLTQGLYAQDILIWFNQTTQIHPDGNGNVPHDASLAATSFAGAMVQLILADGSSPSAPTYQGAGSPQATDGITGAGESLVAFSYFGRNMVPDGTVSDQDLLLSLGLALTDEIFVRVYAEPSSDGMGQLPVPVVYTDPDLLLLYPQAAGERGTFYFDGPVQAVNANNLSPALWGYTIPNVGQGGWRFLAVPEPSSLAFMLAGSMLMLFRRRRS